jgi:hypothetical protein
MQIREAHYFVDFHRNSQPEFWIFCIALLVCLACSFRLKKCSAVVNIDPFKARQACIVVQQKYKASPLFGAG